MIFDDSGRVGTQPPGFHLGKDGKRIRARRPYRRRNPRPDPFQRKIRRAARLASREVAQLVSRTLYEPEIVRLWTTRVGDYNAMYDNEEGLAHASFILSVHHDMWTWVERYESNSSRRIRYAHRQCVDALRDLQQAIDNLATHLKRKETIGRLGRSYT